LAKSSIAHTLRRGSAMLAFALVALACAPAGAARAQTVVSITFDDGASSQYRNARPALAEHGMHATFFINSAFINPQPDGFNPYFMSWAQLAEVAADGNEIAGHTYEDKSLTKEITDPKERREAVCGDRQNLIARGFDPVSFAYPHGHFDASVQAIVRECGYSSARRVRGLKDSDCVNCPTSETIPPGDPYAVRSNSALTGQLGSDALEDYVKHANGTGWVVLTFHDVCHAADCPRGSLDGSVDPDQFRTFLDWLEQDSGAVVKTVREVVPPPAVPLIEPPLPVHAFGPAPDRATAFASLKASKVQDVDKLFVSAAMLEPGTLAATGTVSAPNASRVFKLRGAFATAAPGKVVKLRLKLSKKALRAVKRALRARKRVRAKVTISATDQAGNKKTARRTFKLKD
jgi:peptidoglycan/xylan/chitin deacetylase (PgdA/CDA1 family)